MKKTRQEIRDEVLRPSSSLGYAEERIGRHLLGECDAPAQAELFFRRAAWLNPFEPFFQLHIAQALYEQDRFAEAMELLQRISKSWPAFDLTAKWLERCRKALDGQNSPSHEREPE